MYHTIACQIQVTHSHMLQSLQGGKLTSTDQADIVHLVTMGTKQLLWYEAPPKVHAALLRGTTADLDGNISFEKEALYLDSLNMVTATCLLVPRWHAHTLHATDTGVIPTCSDWALKPLLLLVWSVC